jgi:hypothetical protein
VGRAAAWARPVAACRARGWRAAGGGVPGRWARPGAWARGAAGRLDGRRRRRAGSVGRAAVGPRRWQRRSERRERKKKREESQSGGLVTFFVECPRSRTWLRFFFKNLKINFAECRISGTRQRHLCRVLVVQALDKDLFCSLCRLPTDRHSA